jgi:hypothetical protein
VHTLPPSIHAHAPHYNLPPSTDNLFLAHQVEEQFRNALHGHAVLNLAAAPHTLKALLDKINKDGVLTIKKIITFAETIQCNDIMSDSNLYDANLVCDNQDCPGTSATPSSTTTAVPRTSTDDVTGNPVQAGPTIAHDATIPAATPTPLISEPIQDHIRYTTKPLGFNFASPITAVCDVCKTKYVGEAVLRKAALAELRKHPDAARLVEACENDHDDTFRTRNEALRMTTAYDDNGAFELDMTQLHMPKFQAVLAILVLQYNRHRPGHSRSCFKLKIKGTCRYDLPKLMQLLTTFLINDIQIDQFGHIMFLNDDDSGEATDASDAVGQSAATTITPIAAIEEDDPATAPLPFTAFPQIKAFTLDSVERMDIIVKRKIGSEYINRFNPIVMLSFGWNNDMTTMMTSPGIIHYVTRGRRRKRTARCGLPHHYRRQYRSLHYPNAHRPAAHHAGTLQPTDRPSYGHRYHARQYLPPGNRPKPAGVQRAVREHAHPLS